MKNHEVDAEVPGSHAHEHTHSVRSLSSKLAAHDHPHVHCEDADEDNALNGHSHAGSHEKLPWESGSVHHKG